MLAMCKAASQNYLTFFSGLSLTRNLNSRQTLCATTFSPTSPQWFHLFLLYSLLPQSLLNYELVASPLLLSWQTHSNPLLFRL